MRLVVVLAGTFGFVAVLVGSVIGQRPLENSLISGIISALIAALLLRWWMRLWITSLEQTSREDELVARLDQMEGENKEQSAVKPSEFRKP